MLDVAQPIMRLMNAKRAKNPIFLVMIIMQDPRFVKKGKNKKFSIFRERNGYHLRLLIYLIELTLIME